MYTKRLSFISIIAILSIIFTIVSCQSSRAVISKGINLPEYRYVVFGEESTGDRELDDIVLLVQNEIANHLEVVPSKKGLELIKKGELVLTPHIHVTTEKWDGGHTYISINFYDYDTSQSVAVIKSSGIGLTISHDQQLALSAISKQLYKAFNTTKAESPIERERKIKDDMYL